MYYLNSLPGWAGAALAILLLTAGGPCEGEGKGKVIETKDGSYVDLDPDGTYPLIMDWWTDSLEITNGYPDKINGAHNFRHSAYPCRNVVRGSGSLFNVEFIGNGEDVSTTGGYVDGGVQLPRTYPKSLTADVDTRGRLKGTMEWKAEEGRFPLDITYAASMKEHGRVDFTFGMTPREDVFPHGWLAVFFASYIDKAREQAINFPGYRKGEFGWISYGSLFKKSHHSERRKEDGSVQHWSAPELTRDSTLDGFALWNYVDNAVQVEFSIPFWYGIVDGDGDLGTTDDNMFYGMFFDPRKAKNVQFTLWSFLPADDSWNGEIVWDWSIVNYEAQIGKEFKTNWRVVYKPIEQGDGESLHKAARRIAIIEWLTLCVDLLSLPEEL